LRIERCDPKAAAGAFLDLRNEAFGIVAGERWAERPQRRARNDAPPGPGHFSRSTL
jgi:hypothetical protein